MLFDQRSLISHRRSRTLGSVITLACAALTASTVSAATIELGGPASGYLALANLKNASTQAEIEGAANGLPDYPNFQIPAGEPNAGAHTAIVVSPQSTSHDYSPFFAGTINNSTVTDSDWDTRSAGVVQFDDVLLTGSGPETVPVGALTFDFDTYAWDGVTGNGYDTGAGNIDISPFSPIITTDNDGGGAGNAAAFYNISLSNVGGTGLSFVDGDLVSMDITADLVVGMRIGQVPDFAPVDFGGTFSASGLGYAFDLDDTQSVLLFSDVHMIMNRQGTATLVPEPSTGLLFGLGLAGLAGRRSADGRKTSSRPGAQRQ